MSCDQLHAKFGNHKLGDNILIINMGTATDCPSAKLGKCNAINSGVKCYAFKAEQQYKDHVLGYREKQFKYWRNNSATKIANDIIQKIASRRGKATKYFRFNEAGDFWDQADVKKLSAVAQKLKNFNIVTYGFTARDDLDFSDVNFLVKGSGHNKGNNGTSVILEKNDPVPEGYKLCPGNCRNCRFCMVDNNLNIAFRKH